MRERLQQHFGFGEFREGQEAVIQGLIEGRPMLAVFPTGGGKSLCYQLPALMLDGLTLVISPLIALMKDQVDGLRARGIAAARLDSTLDADELRGLYGRLERRELKLLYITPERLGNEAFRKRLGSSNLSMVAIDEAHCISEWGHNFRPDYLKIAEFCRKWKVRRVLALTATATPEVSKDIRRQFGIADRDHVQLSFHRPNLDLGITPCDAGRRKELLLGLVREQQGSMIVYVTRQETSEEVATFLKREGVSVAAYHAGLPDDYRSEVQRDFMAGGIRVIVATIAFGMGIDKPDIRAVIHYNLPKCLENYTQEIGRAGRDGLPSECRMLACGADLTVLENFIWSDTPTPQGLANLLDRILRLGETFDLSWYDLSVTCDIRPSVIATVLAYLECDGLIEATGRYHDTYRIKLLRDRASALAGMPATQRRMVQRMLDLGTQGRTWISIQPSQVAAQLGVRPEKVVAAIRDLELSGDAALSASGVRHSYRMKRSVDDVAALARKYLQLFERRESADLARLRQVPALALEPRCLTAALLRHFGEEMQDGCGHCDRCRGVPPHAVVMPEVRRPDDEEWALVRALVDENHAALRSPRQLARFLCGMSSPASTAARLSRHDAFGLWSDLPFADVLAFAGSM